MIVEHPDLAENSNASIEALGPTISAYPVITHLHRPIGGGWQGAYACWHRGFLWVLWLGWHRVYRTVDGADPIHRMGAPGGWEPIRPGHPARAEAEGLFADARMEDAL